MKDKEYYGSVEYYITINRGQRLHRERVERRQEKLNRLNAREISIKKTIEKTSPKNNGRLLYKEILSKSTHKDKHTPLAPIELEVAIDK